MRPGRANRGKQETPRPTLWRAADGSLRSSANERDIGDIWAEQERIKLAEAIEADRKQAIKNQNKRNLKTWFRRKKVQVRAGVPVSSNQGKTETPTKEIAVTISLPHVKGLKKPNISRFTGWWRRIPKKKRFLVAVGAPLAVVSFVASFGVYDMGERPQEGNTASTQANPGKIESQAIDKSQTPDYQTVLPAGKTIEELGGWARVSPPEADPVFAYADAINGAQITVSQQSLPAKFKDNEQEVAKLAEQFSATTKLTAGDSVVYVGTSEKGPQSVIFAKDNLLILIKSSARVPDAAWTAYIDTLR